MSARDTYIQDALKTVRTLYTKHGITDPNQAIRIIRERATAKELDAYYKAIRVIDGNGGIG